MVDLILNLNLNVILNEQKDVLKSYYFFDFIVLLFSEETKKTKYPLALSFLHYYLRKVMIFVQFEWNYH